MSTFIEKEPVFYFGELGHPRLSLYRISISCGKIYIYEVGVDEEDSLRLIINTTDWQKINDHIASQIRPNIKP